MEGLCQNRVPRHSSLAGRPLKVSHWHVLRYHLGKGNGLLHFNTDSTFFMKNKLSNKGLGNNFAKIHGYTNLQQQTLSKIFHWSKLWLCIDYKTFVTLVSKLNKNWITWVYGVYFSDNNCHMLKCLWKGAMIFYMTHSPTNVLSSRRDGVLSATTV